MSSAPASLFAPRPNPCNQLRSGRAPPQRARESCDFVSRHRNDAQPIGAVWVPLGRGAHRRGSHFTAHLSPSTLILAGGSAEARATAAQPVQRRLRRGVPSSAHARRCPKVPHVAPRHQAHRGLQVLRRDDRADAPRLHGRRRALEGTRLRVRRLALSVMPSAHGEEARVLPVASPQSAALWRATAAFTGLPPGTRRPVT